MTFCRAIPLIVAYLDERTEVRKKGGNRTEGRNRNRVGRVSRSDRPGVKWLGGLEGWGGWCAHGLTNNASLIIYRRREVGGGDGVGSDRERVVLRYSDRTGTAECRSDSISIIRVGPNDGVSIVRRPSTSATLSRGCISVRHTNLHFPAAPVAAKRRPDTTPRPSCARVFSALRVFVRSYSVIPRGRRAFILRAPPDRTIITVVVASYRRRALAIHAPETKANAVRTIPYIPTRNECFRHYERC